jgi:hypothetical protein
MTTNTCDWTFILIKTHDLESPVEEKVLEKMPVTKTPQEVHKDKYMQIDAKTKIEKIYKDSTLVYDENLGFV